MSEREVKVQKSQEYQIQAIARWLSITNPTNRTTTLSQDQRVVRVRDTKDNRVGILQPWVVEEGEVIRLLVEFRAKDGSGRGPKYMWEVPLDLIGHRFILIERTER